MSGKISYESEFRTWLFDKTAPGFFPKIYSCYDKLEKTCKNAGILQEPLFETVSLHTASLVCKFVEQNKQFFQNNRDNYVYFLAAAHNYLEFIETKVNYKSVPTELNRKKQTKPAPVKTEEDRQLLRKYPIAYEEVYSLLKEKKHCLTIDDITAKITDVDVTRSAVNDIIHNASWIKRTVMHLQNEFDVDFDYDTPPVDYTKATPYLFSYYGISKTPCNSWTELYVTFVSTLIHDYPEKFGPRMSFINGGRIDLTLKWENIMNSPRHVPGTNYNVETFLNANDIVKRMKSLLDICEIEYWNVEIRCRSIIENNETEKTAESATCVPVDKSADTLNKNIQPSEEGQDKHPLQEGESASEDIDQGVITVDLKCNFDYSDYVPYSFSFFDEYKTVCSSWEELYIKFVATLVREYPARFESGMSFSEGKKEDLTVKEKNEMDHAEPLPNTIYFLEVNYSANEMIKNIKSVLDICNVDYKSIEIKCIDKRYANTKTSSEQFETTDIGKSNGKLQSEKGDKIKSTDAGQTSGSYYTQNTAKEQQLEAEESTKNVNTLFDHCNDTLLIYVNMPNCKQKNHNVINCTASIPDLYNKKIEMNVHYCVDCKKFYLTLREYEYYRKRYHYLPFRFERIESMSGDGGNYYNRAQFSPLYLCGYNVREGGLTESQRRSLLSTLIDQEVFTKPYIINFLEYLIETNGSNRNCYLAREKWKDDMEFVMNYKIEEQIKVEIDDIESGSKHLKKINNF